MTRLKKMKKAVRELKSLRTKNPNSKTANKQVCGMHQACNMHHACSYKY